MERIICSHKFQFGGEGDLSLSDLPTEIHPVYQSKIHYKELLKDHIRCLKSYQERLYASKKYSILLIFQAMDSAGKDGAIKHVMSGVNPQGCQVFSFKPPSQIELQHDFLWRSSLCLPEIGHIGIFNRSYYEDVLIAKVHSHRLADLSWIGTKSEELSFWENRYESIKNYERHLHNNGTRIIKIFLHMSETEQRKRFIARIEDHTKNWKFSPQDLEERKFWGQYMSAYEQCINATRSDIAPWYIVPADNKKNARLIISQILCDVLEELKLVFPVLSQKHREELLRIRDDLAR